MPLSPTDPIPEPILVLECCLIRPYHPSDIPEIPPLANDKAVTEHLRLTFPSPYTVASSEFWVNLCLSQDPPCNFLIVSTPTPLDRSTHRIAGAIGLAPTSESEKKAYEIGYWLGREFWGAKIASEACAAFTKWAFSEKGISGLERIEAEVYAGNLGSARVLEKTGYALEGTKRRGACKGGKVMDVLLYGLLKEDLEVIDRGEQVVAPQRRSAFEKAA